MMYPYLTLDNKTEIVHSQMLKDKTVKVYNIPSNKLKNMMRVIEANSKDIIDKWFSFFGGISFYC